MSATPWGPSLAAAMLIALVSRAAIAAPPDPPGTRAMPDTPSPITLFLCGDVMTGRGVDQVQAQSCDPRLYEAVARDARVYVRLAERRGDFTIERPVEPAYAWGEALDDLARARPDVRIINLETAVTDGGAPWPGKGIHYRMHPANVAVLTAAGIDACALANNHVLDWGHAGLEDTLAALERADVHSAGAGRTLADAVSPAVIDVPGKGRVIVFSFGLSSSGIPRAWAADDDRAGVNLLPDLSSGTVRKIAERVEAAERPGDVVVASIHWGGNWGYTVPRAQRAFAHKLIERAGVDVVHGHSSHHRKGIEVHRGKLILYGCGDFINDYEGIEGHESYRDELGLMYFARVSAATGELVSLRMVPTCLERLQVRRATPAEARWQLEALGRACRRFGTRVVMAADGAYSLEWKARREGAPPEPRGADGAPARSPDPRTRGTARRPP
ncbi:MAG: CapA family protein [Planctomycetota bacterium]|jgi:poly-gamma-glutamate synthesis protein (capsule biosynthesis protein)